MARRGWGRNRRRAWAGRRSVLLEQVPAINREIASRVLSEEKRLLELQDLIHLNGQPYTLFVG